MFSIIEKQMLDENIPTYGDERIRSILCKEQKEELIDLFEHQNDRLRMLPTPDIPFVSDTMNAGFKCSSLIRKGLYDRLLHMTNMLDILTENKRKIAILVYEGLRDCQTQKILFDKFQKEIQTNNPGLSEDEVIIETCSLIAHPDDEPSHSTGGSVDLRLFDLDKNEFLDMGKFGHLFSEDGTKNMQSYTFCSGLTDEQKNNRSLLLNAATMSGLVNYPLEWWHFSFGDKYFCYYTDQPCAIYGKI